MFLLSYKLGNKISVFVFAMIIYGKNKTSVKYHPGGESNLDRNA